MSVAIRIEMPAHLRNLARENDSGELWIDAEAPTIGAVLDALEARYPMLRGTIRDHTSKVRRPFLRFFVCQQDWSHEPMDLPLPDEVASGREPLLIVGAIAGGCL